MQIDNILKPLELKLSNPFQAPRNWRQRIIDKVIIPSELNFTSRGFICALITSRCHIGCKHCMFASNMSEGRTETNTMTKKRIQSLLKLVEDSNTGYFLVSGGGEGFLELQLMYQIIEGSTADVTWIASSGFWATTKQNTRRIISKCFDAHLKGNINNHNRETILRISFDKHHIERIGKSNDPFGFIRRIVKVFDQEYSKHPNFSLLLHALEGEEVLVKKLAKGINASIQSNIIMKHANAKITESAMLLRLESGYELPVTFAKLLLSDIAVDLREKELLAKRIKIWETDAYVNEKDLTGLQINENGYGNDMLVIYDGRVAGGWQCEMPDVYINIDNHDYTDIMQLTLSDPSVLATLEKGQRYRLSVIDEVNPNASIRAKAVNIRDYTSLTLLEEDLDKLYYTIRAIQDYRKEGRLKYKEKMISQDILKVVNSTSKELRDWYNASNYDIVAQFREYNYGFHALESAMYEFVKNRNFELFVSKVKEIGKNDQRRIDQWRLLLLRIHYEWYNIKSWDYNFLTNLEEIIMLIDQHILKGVHPHEGLSWKSIS